MTSAHRMCTIVENQQQKLRSLLQLKKNLKSYNYPDSIIQSVSKKLWKFLKMNLGNQEKKKQIKFYHFIKQPEHQQLKTEKHIRRLQKRFF